MVYIVLNSGPAHRVNRYLKNIHFFEATLTQAQ